MTTFVAGLLVMGYAVVALFFGRFYQASRDRLFLFFACGFGLLAIQRAGLAAAAELPLPVTSHYVLRLLAFLLILAGIIDKNRR
jgi:hypothetical protein